MTRNSTRRAGPPHTTTMMVVGGHVGQLERCRRVNRRATRSPTRRCTLSVHGWTHTGCLDRGRLHRQASSRITASCPMRRLTAVYSAHGRPGRAWPGSSRPRLVHRRRRAPRQRPVRRRRCLRAEQPARQRRLGRRGRQARHLRKAAGRRCEEADAMIAACRAGVKLMYAEELASRRSTCASGSSSTRARSGRVYLLGSAEALRPPLGLVLGRRAVGGGVLMDMGCHAIAGSAGCSGRAGRRERVCDDVDHVPRRQNGRGRGQRVAISTSRAASSASPRTAGRSRAAWTIASRSTAPGAWRMPTCCAATRRSRTAVGYDYALEKAGSTRGWTFTCSRKP